MLLKNYGALPTILVMAMLLSGCPTASTPTKEQQNSPGAATKSQASHSLPSGGTAAGNAGNRSASNTLPGQTQQSGTGENATTAQSQPTTSQSQTNPVDSNVEDIRDNRHPEHRSADSALPAMEQQSGPGNQGSDLREPDLTDTEPATASVQEPTLTDEQTEQTEQTEQQYNNDTSPASAEPSATAQATTQTTTQAGTPPVLQTDSSASAPRATGTNSAPMIKTATVDPVAPAQTNVQTRSYNSGIPAPDPGAITTAETISILDRQLSHATGRFDQMILREREKIRTQARQRGGAIISAGNPAFDEPEQRAGDPETASVAGSAARTSAASGHHSTNRTPVKVASYAPPTDIPDGNDDDVVARQLREAAMREPNPQLRKKLWDEYRKYKGITP